MTGSLNLFNHRTNVDINNRLVCYDIKELGKQLKKIGMLVVQDQVWNRVTINRAAHKSTRYYIDEMHLLCLLYTSMMLVMLPFFMLAMYEKHGQPLEKIVGNILKVAVIRPKQRPYQTNNFNTA